MKLKPIPMLCSLLIVAVALFGGWYIYNTQIVEKSLLQNVAAIQGVEEADVNSNNQHVVISITLADDANYREVTNELEKATAQFEDNKEVHIEIENTSNDQLDDWWTSILFDIAQAMDNKQLAQIPEILEVNAAPMETLEYWTELDEENVYIRLNLEDGEKFIMLPREPEMLRAWSDA
ncbi:hypothetical protein [Longirhabdus pacifica]|uniref:hypothetical protein n=1 Tax=Longirhabdus pacifica TaxID=2305227 RepID=UPI00100878F7|nr:hypothetical protein [Longirhabdus pacifica]